MCAICYNPVPMKTRMRVPGLLICAFSLAINSPAQTISDKQWWDQRSSVEEYKGRAADVGNLASVVQFYASKLSDQWTEHNFDSELS